MFSPGQCPVYCGHVLVLSLGSLPLSLCFLLSPWHDDSPKRCFYKQIYFILNLCICLCAVYVRECKHYGGQKTTSDALELELQGDASHLPPAILLVTKLCFVNCKTGTCSSALSPSVQPLLLSSGCLSRTPSVLFLAVATVFFPILSHHFLDNLYGCLPDHQIFMPWDPMLLSNLFIHPFDLLFI